MENNIRLVTSATQINEYLTCQRRWVAGYLLDLKQPETEAMAYGKIGHKMLEVYHNIGKIPDINYAWQFNKDRPVRYPGLSAKKCLKHMPPPKTGRAEHGFSFVINGIKFIGYIDLEWKDEQSLWVTDYKFVSSFQSALDANTLTENIQATIYSTKAILQHKVKKVNLRWIYALSTKNPSSRKVESYLKEEQVKKQLKVLLNVCEDMIVLKDKVSQMKGSKEDIINSLPPTVKSCSRYAGCYYLNKCKLTQEQLMQGDFDEMDQTLKNKLTEMGLSKYVKQDPTPEEKVEEKKEKTTTTMPTNLNKYVKQPEQHKIEKKEKKEPEVQLNAPENYVDKPNVCSSFSLTDEEKAVLKGIIDRL